MGPWVNTNPTYNLAPCKFLSSHATDALNLQEDAFAVVKLSVYFMDLVPFSFPILIR